MDTREIVNQYDSGDAQSPVYLDGYVQEFRSVQLEPVVTGVGYVQATASCRQDVEDGHAGWVTWPAGAISAVTQDTVSPAITAIRVYRTSGNLKLTVRLV